MRFVSKLLVVSLTAVAVLPFMRGIPVHAASDIKIDKSSFPDEKFRAVISGTDYDKDSNGWLTVAERNSVINIHCENHGITSIKGVELFPNLEGLWCLNNNISSWDLSGNPHLKGIWCSKNAFTSLSFKDNPELEWVYCFGCKLTSLDLTGNPEMAYVECNDNKGLKSLNLKNNKKLENLFCSDCGLTSLDLTNNPLLCELDCFNNNLTSINLSKNTKLKRLDVWNNPKLGNVDVSKLKELEFYNCAKTGCTQVNVTNNTELQMLVASYNENIKTLDLTHNPRLAVLHLDCDWRLQSLDLSKNPKLYYLQAFGLHGIDTLDISNNSRLIKAYKDGVYKDEPQLGDVHSYTVNYGGSGEYFDNLLHCLVVDNDVKIVTNGSTSSPVYDSIIDTNDGHSDSEQFATREEAIALLYKLAGSPAVSGKSTFTDVPSGASYAKAVKWGQDKNICFGYPDVCSDTFGVGQLISRQDFALMAHRFAGVMKFGTAFDYGRTDWFIDFKDIDYYAWGAFTWSIQWGVLKTKNNYCYPRGRLTKAELQAGCDQIFHLDQNASYSSQVNGNGTAPEITEQPEDYMGYAGSVAVFNVSASGAGLSFQWQLKKGSKWADLTSGGADTPMLSVKVDDSKNGKIYRCVIKDTTGNEIISDEVKITVKEIAIKITSQPSDYTGAAGSVAKFSVTASGEGLTYQWQLKKGSKWADLSSGGAKTASMSVKVDDSKNGKVYRCLITNASGEQLASKEVAITVKEPVSSIVIDKQPVDVECNAGEYAVFTCSAKGDGLSYQWQLKKGSSWSNLTTGGADTNTLKIKGDLSRNGKIYRCVITDAKGDETATKEAVLRVTEVS